MTTKGFLPGTRVVTNTTDGELRGTVVEKLTSYQYRVRWDDSQVTIAQFVALREAEEQMSDLFGNDQGMEMDTNALEQVNTPGQQCMRCGKVLTMPYKAERFVYGVDSTTPQDTIEMFGFACLDCQRDHPDFDWFEED